MSFNLKLFYFASILFVASENLSIARGQLASTIIPVYNFPSFNTSVPGNWQTLIDAKNAYKTVTAWVVGGLPKYEFNTGKYQEAFKKLLDADLNVIGYVNTAHATLPIKNVTENVQKWFDLYNGIAGNYPKSRSGIFWDNMHNGKIGTQAVPVDPVTKKPIPTQGDVLIYYQKITKFARDKGLTGLIVGNPASFVHESLINTVDTFNVLEANDGYRPEARYTPDYTPSTKYPSSKYLVVINNITESQLDHKKINIAKKHVKYIWVSELYTPGITYTSYSPPSYAVKLFKYLSN